MTELELKAIMLDNISEFLCVVYNSFGEIIYPDNFNTLERFKSIASASKEGDNIYHLEKTNEWFEAYDKLVHQDGDVYHLVYYRNISRFKRLEQILKKDYVTGMANRESAVSEIQEYIRYALAMNEEFTVVLSDVDHFKEINDTYGHLFGDTVLKNIGDLTNENVRRDDERGSDIAGRYGGDEFFGLIKKISYEDSIKWVERAHKLSSELVHTSRDGEIQVTNITMSIGMYHVSKNIIKELNSLSLTLPEISKILFERCDEELYRVKEEHHHLKKEPQSVLILKKPN